MGIVNDFSGAQALINSTDLSQNERFMGGAQAVGDNIIAAIAGPLDKLTEAAKEKFSEGMSKAQDVVSKAKLPELASTKSAAPDMTALSKRIEPTVEKTPELSLEAMNAVKSAKQSMGDKWPPQEAVAVAGVDEAAKSAMLTIKSQTLVQTKDQGMSV
jgi:hypothetical protein